MNANFSHLNKMSAIEASKLACSSWNFS